MPTGYTSGVATGKVTDFREYALQCARAFGACIELRDEPMSSDIPEFKASDRSAKALQKAERELDEFMAMNQEDRHAMYEAESSARIARANERIKENQESLARYEAMLKKAKAFKAPTADHQEYAAFLVSQLEDSIRFDCMDDYYEKEKQSISFSEWQTDKRVKLVRDIEYHKKENREELARTALRNAWVQALKDSL